MLIKNIGIKLLKYGGYSLFGSFVFFLTFWMFMDWSLIKERVERELSKVSGYTVTIGDFNLGVGSITLKDMLFVSNPEKPDEKPTKFRVSSLEIKSSIMKLANGNQNLSFIMNAMGGNVSGSFSQQEEEKVFSIKISSVKVSEIPGMKSFITLPMVGRISGGGEIKIPKVGFRRSNGKFDITCANCVIGDGKTKVKATFLANPKNKASAKWSAEGVTFPPMNLGKFAGNIEIKNGTANFNDFIASSKDGEAELGGNIKLRDPLKNSMADLYFKFKFSEEAKKKNDSLEAIELSLYQKGKRADGYFGIVINGLVSKIIIKPQKTGILDYKRPKNGRPGAKNGMRPPIMRPGSMIGPKQKTPRVPRNPNPRPSMLTNGIKGLKKSLNSKINVMTPKIEE